MIKKYCDCVCPSCGDINTVAVDSLDYAAWQSGEHAQDACSYLSPNEREMLISGMCPKCWQKLFGCEEDTEPEEWEELDLGFDPYLGQYTDDC